MYAEIRSGTYGLPQDGVLAHDQLTKRLNQAGFFEAPKTPGMWNHKWRPMIFTLVVDGFGAEHVGAEHVKHLIQTLKHHYDTTEDWTGNKFLGIDLDWDYAKKTVRLSMNDYINTALQRFQHERPSKPTHSPHPHQ